MGAVNPKSRNGANNFPKVAILMATYNGAPWLLEQIDSILTQVNVDVTLYISDDCSTDGTWKILCDLAAKDSRIILLPCNQKFGNAGKNFYRLINDVSLENYHYIAFSDQDDIWRPSKLSRHAGLIEQLGVEAVSSNVTAFWDNGREKLIKKSQAARPLDYIFEAAGPGCTYLMTSKLVCKTKEVLNTPICETSQVSLHDWLSYAICRSMGWGWHVDHEPSVLYRQHATNLLGANSGIKPKLARLKKLNDGWYRNQIMRVAGICLHIREDAAYRAIHTCLSNSTYLNRLRILRFVPLARRKLSDRVILFGIVLLGIF